MVLPSHLGYWLFIEPGPTDKGGIKFVGAETKHDGHNSRDYLNYPCCHLIYPGSFHLERHELHDALTFYLQHNRLPNFVVRKFRPQGVHGIGGLTVGGHHDIARSEACRQIALAHGHYDPTIDRSIFPRPSWLIDDRELAATGADYVALGHWNRAVRVGVSSVAAYYSGSPEYAGTVNLVRLTRDGRVVVAQQELDIARDVDPPFVPD